MTERNEKTGVDEIVVGECPSCETEAVFEYVGDQDYGKNGGGHLYNCNSCFSSLPRHRLKVRAVLI